MQRFVLALALVSAACGGDSPATPDAAAPDAPGPPTLAVTASPTTVARGDTVTFTVTVTNFSIVSPTGTVNEGEGHFHYYRDDVPNYISGWTPTVTFRTGPNTSLGDHAFRFVLANAAHEELMPSVEATATFTVQ